MADSFADAAKKIGKLSNDLGNMQQQLGKVGLKAKNDMLASISPETGGDLRLSHVGKRGGKVGVKYTVKGNDKVELAATGPMALIESPIHAHLIGVGRRKVRKSGFIKGASYGHPVRGPILHPGTHGKKSWTHAVTKVTPKVTRYFTEAVNEIVTKNF